MNFHCLALLLPRLSYCSWVGLSDLGTGLDPLFRPPELGWTTTASAPPPPTTQTQDQTPLQHNATTTQTALWSVIERHQLSLSCIASHPLPSSEPSFPLSSAFIHETYLQNKQTHHIHTPFYGLAGSAIPSLRNIPQQNQQTEANPC